MGSIATLQSQFRINYPYYGLFQTADIKMVDAGGDTLFRCNIINGSIIWLRKLGISNRWLDVNQGIETPLARLLGNYIEDHLRSSR